MSAGKRPRPFWPDSNRQVPVFEVSGLFTTAVPPRNGPRRKWVPGEQATRVRPRRLPGRSGRCWRRSNSGLHHLEEVGATAAIVGSGGTGGGGWPSMGERFEPNEVTGSFTTRNGSPPSPHSGKGISVAAHKGLGRAAERTVSVSAPPSVPGLLAPFPPAGPALLAASSGPGSGSPVPAVKPGETAAARGARGRGKQKPLPERLLGEGFLRSEHQGLRSEGRHSRSSIGPRARQPARDSRGECWLHVFRLP